VSTSAASRAGGAPIAAGTPTDAAPARAPRTTRAGEALLTLATGLAAAIPVIAATVNAIDAGWMPVADRGIIATRAHDVFTSHMPLVGQYTLAGEVTGHVTHSLGPMLFWLLAVPAYYGSTVGMTLTMGALNTLSIVGCIALARHRGGRVLMALTALMIALMCQSLAAETFHDIWNPSAGLFPFTLLIFLCWSLACGSYRLLPLTVIVASFVVQAHLTYLPPTLGLLAVGLGGLAVGSIRRRSRPRIADVGHAATTAKAQAAGETKPAGDAQTAGETKLMGDAQTVGKTKPMGDAQTVGKTKPMGDAQTVGKTKPMGDAQTVGKTKPMGDAQTVGKTKPMGDAQTVADVTPTVTARTPRRRRQVLVWGLATVLAGGACWSATIVGQLTEHPGNLTLVVESATKPKATLGADVGWHAVVRAVGIPPWWLRTPKSRWQRKYEVRSPPSALATDSCIAMLAALVLICLVGLRSRRRELAALALIALVLCPALAAVASSTPTPVLLSATLGYTMWWGSQAGMAVWLALAWALWLALAWSARRLWAARERRHAAAGSARTSMPTATPSRPAGARIAGRGRHIGAIASIALSLLALGGVAAVGGAVAAQAGPDEHAVTFAAIRTIDARLGKLVPPRGSVLLEGALDGATMPIKPAVRYFLVTHNIRVLAPGSYLRLGTWYELYDRPYREAIYLSDVPRAPVKHAPLAFDVSFREGAVRNTVYVWISHKPSR
jgi:hypothetical protein